jgi:trk system potassium uptake protein TrkH
LKHFPTVPAQFTPHTVRRKEVDLRLVPLGFLALISIGCILLMLPATHRPGQTIKWLDAFFLSTSATCVTGLSTVNVAETFNFFGQAVLLVLIQLGGLGIFTASLSLVLLSGQKLSLADEHTISATVGKLRQVRPFDLFVYACLFVFLFELAGAVVMFLQMDDNGAVSVWQTLWEASFHSVSAFCNAGISIYPEGLARWKDQPGLLAVIEALVVAGGIGLMTLINLRYFYFWKRDPRRRGYLTLQTKISVFMAVLLLAVGTVLTFAFESSHTMAGATGWKRLSWSFFHSTMSRTAGFNTVDLSGISPPGLLTTLVLMFIGGAPGSMAGGLKTVTFAVLVLTAWTTLRRQENIHVFGRRISRQMSSVAVMLSLLAGAVLILGIGLLMFTEQRSAASQTPQQWLGVVFEAVSAFGTVGLSTGVTPLLTSLGKWVIIALMFTGRVAPLVLSIYLARPSYPWHVRQPREDLSLG